MLRLTFLYSLIEKVHEQIRNSGTTFVQVRPLMVRHGLKTAEVPSLSDSR